MFVRVQRGSVGGIKCVAGAGVNVVESEQAGGAGTLESKPNRSCGFATSATEGSSNRTLCGFNPRRRRRLLDRFVPETHPEDPDFTRTGPTVLPSTPPGSRLPGRALRLK
ncbi:hypothetical protein MTP99_013099 [Tenebrio molitor]|jgi:hypothetical protein|nr:hypothetical protein MTP99_013099 [Tenebrio molitor]